MTAIGLVPSGIHANLIYFIQAGPNRIMSLKTESITVVLIALYRYQNFPIRIMHSLLEKIDGIKPHTVFFQNFYTNALKLPTAKEEDLFKKKIIELNPKVVGFSVYSPFALIAKRLTKIIKDNTSALVGEGEGALVDLVTSIRDKTEYQNIENLWINNNGHIIKNPMRPLIQDLDSIPFPAYARDSFHFIGSNKLAKNDPALSDPTLQVMPARGCPFTCSYCVNSLLRPMYRDLGRFTRRRSVDNVIDEMKEVLQFPGSKKNVVEFHDENFGTVASWLDEFESRYKKEIGLPFKVQYNQKLVKTNTISKLVKIGLHRVKFGIEAGTDQIRNQIFHRPGKNSEIVNLVNSISSYEVKIRYDLMLDNPYDTPETLKDTIDLLMQLPKPLRFNLYSLQYFPKYPLTRKALNDGHISPEEVSLDSLQKKMARNWAYVPKLLPYTKKQMLQNIVWLYIYGNTRDKRIKSAVFNESLSALLFMHYLNFKANFWGKFQTIKRFLYRNK
jgi:radical SAM superfamily enzyme YgiQ (UPF0313 family)